MARISRVLRTIPLLITVCFLLSGCPEFESIEQPSSVSPGEIFTVFVEAITRSNEYIEPVPPYFGICLPEGWTIPGDAITYTGVYDGVITYDPNLALEQEAMSPSPEGYYWWVGDGNAVDVIGLVYSEVQIQPSSRLGLYSIDYMLGNSFDGLNQDRSNNHLIAIVDEDTPRGLKTAFQGDSVLLSWVTPAISEGLTGYDVYRDGQLIDTIPDEDTEYTDENLPSGVFWYSVSAVYQDGREHLTPYEVRGLVFLGTGAPNDPYQIATAEQLVCIADFPALTEESFILTNSIELDPNLMGEAAFEQSVIPSFSGTFDGNGFLISNLTLTGFGHLGLIGTIEEGGVVQNLGVVDANVTGHGDHIGIIAAYNHGTVSNSYSTGTVRGLNYVGGLVGYNYGDITDCYSTGTLTGDWSVGGLVGYNYGSIISSYSAGSVAGDSSVGGLVGYNYMGTVTSCYSTGSVHGDSWVGGLVGENSSTIVSCYSTGSVNGNEDIGGLVGTNGGSITSCFWNMETSGSTISDGGIGLTTAEMMDPYMLGLNGFTNDPNWILDASRDYPRLAWEGTTGQVIPEPVIDWLDGQGTEQEPYRIDTADQAILLSRASKIWDKHFILGADIDLDPNLPGGQVFSQAVIQVFSGVFDGNDHTISHLTIRGINRVGMFGETGSGTRIFNLALEAVDVNGTGWSVGGLVGNNHGSITSCHSTGSVTGGRNAVGGLVGYNHGSVSNCDSSALVSGEEAYVGGLVGRNIRDGSISSCHSTGSVRDSGSNGHVGGLVGGNSGSITSSYSTGTVTGEGIYTFGAYAIGGLAGSNSGSITTSYSSGDAVGRRYIGGFVGWNIHDGSITSCYSTGSVSGDEERVGGLVGYNDEGTIISSYSTGAVSGDEDVGGLVGSNYGSITSSFWDIETSGLSRSDGGMGLTTLKMKDINTFLEAGWGCLQPGTWTIDDSNDYPRLWWERQAGEPIAAGVPCLPDYLAGTGTAEDPYLINTAEELNLIGLARCYWDSHFKLTADVDLSTYTGIAFNKIGREQVPFTGVFDGGGHTISNFSYACAEEDDVGLFGYVAGPEAEIRDLGLIEPNVAVKAGNYVGALVGCHEQGLIRNCCVRGGIVSGNEWIGGLVGFNTGTITSCHSTGSVTGYWAVGGLVGSNGLLGSSYEGTITSCCSAGSVTGLQDVGGLTGINRDSVTTSYSTSSVTGYNNVGGLVGFNTGSITASYSTGAVSGERDVGGLVGFGILGMITSCYSTGLVTGDSFVGGLVGYYGEIMGYYDAITLSFWDIETSGLSGSDGGVGLTTAEMMDPYILGLNGFANDPNWILDAGRDYPRLTWEGTTGEIIPEPVVDWLDGQGTEEEPYRIDTADQLIFLSKAGGLWDKHFILGADIDLDPNLPGRQIFAQAVFLVFSGVFDGNGHTIAHLTIKGRGFLGLFGQATSEARISNIILDAVDVAGTGSWVGALVGGNKGNITSCCSTGTVNGDSTDGDYFGGLVGRNDGTIMSSYSTGSVSGHSYVGGLVGRNYDGSITSCYSTGLVSGELLLGGLVGSNRGSITTSYSTGLVSGERSVGGLVGDSSWGTITSCYSTGPVHGDSFVGGLVGRQGDGTTCTVTSSVWDIETSAQTTSACGGTGLTTAEMQTSGTFLEAGWDFINETTNGTEDIWWIDEGNDYPRFWWEAQN